MRWEALEKATLLVRRPLRADMVDFIISTHQQIPQTKSFDSIRAVAILEVFKDLPVIDQLFTRMAPVA